MARKKKTKQLNLHEQIRGLINKTKPKRPQTRQKKQQKTNKQTNKKNKLAHEN